MHKRLSHSSAWFAVQCERRARKRPRWPGNFLDAHYSPPAVLDDREPSRGFTLTRFKREGMGYVHGSGANKACLRMSMARMFYLSSCALLFLTIYLMSTSRIQTVFHYDGNESLTMDKIFGSQRDVKLANTLHRSFLQLEDLCSTDQIRASYHRSSKTSILLVQGFGNSTPCALVKLSCRAISNLGSAIVTDEGYARRRQPVVDEVLPEIINNLVLRKSVQARKVLPQGNGVVIENASVLLPQGDLDLVPLACYWENDLLTGLAFRFIPNLQPFKLSTKFFNKTTGINLLSLATTLVVDAFSSNSDRDATRNLFSDSKQLWSLDNPGIFPPKVDSNSSRALRSMVKKPNILKKLQEDCLSRQQRRKLLATSLKVAREICGDKGQLKCQQLQDYIVHFLPHDPHAAIRLSQSAYNSHLFFMCQSSKSSRQLIHHFVPCSRGLQSFMGRTEWNDSVDNVEVVKYVAMHVARRMHLVVQAIQTCLT